MRSLARGYESARGVSETILQGLREHRDSFKVKEQNCVFNVIISQFYYKLPSWIYSDLVYVFVEAGLRLAQRLVALVAC
jgi:hypothetical protein